MEAMSDVYRYLKILGPEVPVLLKSGIWHTLGISPSSSKWDARTNMTVSAVRSLLSRSSTPISRQQAVSNKDPGVKGAVWAAPVTLPVTEEDDVQRFLFEAIDDLKASPEQYYEKPSLRPVEAEWQGHRAGVGANEPPLKGVSPSDLYAKLMADVKSPATMLYFHGGAHYLMDPATHRPIVSRVCEISGARALSLRYRLAPEHPFPAGLLDCLVGYLSLLHPPQGSMHEAVKPEHVVFAGDSAGGNLCLALLGVLLQLQRKAETSGARAIKFNGQMIPLPLPLPAGIAPISPWTDMTRSMPSMVGNHHYDYLPLPVMSLTATPGPAAPAAGGEAAAEETFAFESKRVSKRIHNPGENKNPFPCERWAEVPPRADIYMDGSMFCHPLVSPLAANIEFWKGAPPVFMEVGEEMLSDEGNIVARRLHKAGAKVRWVGFEAMPHVFVMMFGQTGCVPKTVDKGYEVWGSWIKGLVEGVKPGDKTKMEGGTWFSAPKLELSEVNIETLATHVSDAECAARMREEGRRRKEAYEKLVASSKL